MPHSGDSRDVGRLAEVLRRTVEHSPDPILWIDADGNIELANQASTCLLWDWDVDVGDPWPEHLRDGLEAARENGHAVLEVDLADNVHYTLTMRTDGDTVFIYGLDSTDQETAEARVRDLSKFPAENPNPVLRVLPDTTILYANPATRPILRHWGGIGVGEPLPLETKAQLAPLLDGHNVYLEVECNDVIYGLTFAPVRNTPYVNVYGRDITQQRAAEDNLIAARDEALQANRAKSAFLANMSHELRTPMNAIIGYSEMLMEDAEFMDSAEMVPDLAKIHSAGRHLLSLINDILDLSKIEAGRMDLYIESVVVDELLDDVASTVRPLVEKNGNTLALELDPKLPVIRTDLTKVRQILLNLVSNAAKFTERGTITLAVVYDEGDDTVSFAVRDTGIGMSKEQLDSVFEAFRQADASTSRKYGGTGLGLTITKRFVELMGGDITVTSSVGSGTTFTVLLPRKAAGATSMTEIPRLDLAARNPSELAGDKGLVLVIDDDEAVRDIIEATLVRAGYTVALAEDGEKGLAMARELKPMAITLDIIMPAMDGWTVLSRLKADPDMRDIPVILASINADRKLGFALGATDFLTKPIDRQRLLGLLSATGRSGGKVLVVDDDSDIRTLMARTLDSAGWSTIEAADGYEAMMRLEQEPDAILLDLMMPLMDGFSFLDELRQREDQYRDIPVIVVTALDLTSEERTRLDGNVHQVLQKGRWARDELLDHVCKVLERVSNTDREGASE